MKRFNQRITTALAFVAMVSGCTRILEIDLPKNQLTTDAVFADSATAVAALANVYGLLGNQVHSNLNKYMSAYTDEYFYHGSTAGEMEYFMGNVSPMNGTNNQMWNNLYLVVYSCNQIIEEADQSSGLSESLKATLTGESKALRAFAYLNLQMAYGSIPLVLRTNVDENRVVSQTDSATVFNQILADLLEARTLLGEQYPTAGRVRANKWGASALLARVSLYASQWQEAERYASEVIDRGMYGLSPAVSDAFKAGNGEAILQLWNEHGYLVDASALIPATSDAIPSFALTPSLVGAMSELDRRKQSWVGTATVSTEGGAAIEYYYPFKYKNHTPNTGEPEYLTVVRLAELYLIRAEAKARLGDLEGAVADLNHILQRAGLPAVEGNVGLAECLELIMNERRIELFGEWGHRMMDLKRTGSLHATMKTQKPDWLERAVVFPIPQNELTYNINLKQNKGY